MVSSNMETNQMFFTKHHFIRFPLLDGTIQIMCTKCPKAFIVKQEINTDDYHDL